MVWTVLSSPVVGQPEATEEYGAPLPTPLHTLAIPGGTGPLVNKNFWCSRWTLALFMARLITESTPTFFKVPHMMTLVQHLRRYFKNGMPFEVLKVIKESPVVRAFTEVVCPCFPCYRQLIHIQECQWKQRSSGLDHSHPPLRLRYWLVDFHCIICEIMKQLIQTFNIRSMIHKWKTYNVWSGTRMYYG